MSAVEPRYRILRRLGQGGMAEVFEAELAAEHGFVRKVALKRMLGDAAADPAAARRFLDEARIASRLHHANIVAVLDVGLLDGLPFQVLELIDGVNAQQLVQRAGGRLPLEIALAIAAEVARALDHAHRARDAAGVPLGVVHRDVKPANVLVSWDGDVKLGDFGIALARDREARTETGGFVGTAGFIAPEQRLRGEVDGRADVFALGLALHALITGRNPLADLAVEVGALEGDPVPIDDSLPADVRALIARAVATARLDRPDAGALATAIDAALAARGTRDPRGHLRRYLASLGETRRAPAGALDALLGIEVVPEVAPDIAPVAEVPHYRTAHAPRESSSRRDAPPPRDDARPSSRGRHRLLGAAIAVVLVGASGVGLWKLVAPPDSGEITPASEVPAPTSTRGSANEVVAAKTPPEVAATTSPGELAKPARAPTRDRPTRDRAAGTAAVPGRTLAAKAPAEPGWLQVYGDSLVGGEVLVDGGAWRGYVPNRLEVPQGAHRVTVRLRDGSELPTKPIDITGFHTSVRPLRLTW